jgi:hypothetical protein
VFIVAASVVASKTPAKLIHFRIKDQFNRPHDESEFAGKTVLIFNADKKGSQYQGRWVKAVRDSLANRGALDEVQFMEVADLRGVPFFVKRTVKKKFPKDKEKWVLMDWKGRFAKAYEFEADQCSILLIGPDGKLVSRTSGSEVDEQVVLGLLERIKMIRSQNAPHPQAQQEGRKDQ